MNAILRKLRQEGPRRSAAAGLKRLVRPVHLLRTRGAPEYHDPTDEELTRIEDDLRALGLPVESYKADPQALQTFRERFRFPVDYHGGPAGSVYEEKILEHFVAWDLLGLARTDRWPYVDIASATSPWARLLREQGLEAYSVDLAPHPSLAWLPYYIRSDATAMPFADSSIGGASLQCAFEMFVGHADMLLLPELARTLRPGACAVITPLYMHTHACFYQSPEHWGRPLGDADAKAYCRRHARDVPASRKYSAATLRERVWDPARRAGLEPRLLRLDNKYSIGRGIYLHFVLVLTRQPARAEAG